MTRHSRGSSLGFLALLTLAAVTACGSGAAPAAGGGSAASATFPASEPAAAGRQALQEAIASTSALHSYAFAATQTLGPASSTTLIGTAVRPSAVTYVMSVRGKRMQVVRLSNATYLREIPGNWSRVAHPGAAVDPAASLLALLAAVSQPTATAVGGAGAQVIHGVIPAPRVRAAGLPAGSGTATVSVTLDPRHRVTAVVVHTAVSLPGSRPVTLGLSTSYSGFDAVPDVTSPL